MPGGNEIMGKQKKVKELIATKTAALGNKLPQVGECPVVMISAEKGTGIGQLLDTVLQVNFFLFFSKQFFFIM
jgi:predicted GTPase